MHTGETATFTSAFAGTTQNVIGRVTGPNASQIDGLVASTVPGASLWLINPNGLVIGPGATLDVQGSFYASTADAVLLPNGGRFDARDPQASTLTIGNPVAFGFLDPGMGSISISGATLRVLDALQHGRHQRRGDAIVAEAAIADDDQEPRGQRKSHRRTGQTTPRLRN